MSIRSVWFVRLEWAVVLTLAWGVATAVPAGPVGKLYPGLTLRGEADLRWWGFDIYTARFWASADPRLYALEIVYRRGFSADEILAATRDELLRLGHRRGPVDTWIERLRGVIPSVRRGDRLVGVNVPGVGIRFYSAGQTLGEIADPEFATAFCGIWLGPQTRLPALHEAWLEAE